MYKLVIVEDEDNIRHSLESFIPWEKMGFQVVGAFSDGEDAFAYLKENSCDALLTDILMRRMSGLELVQQLSQIHPEIKVVLLSGHSDFAYAQQAITYKVVHYLVKPVDEDELMDVFKGIKDQLDTEQIESASSNTETRELKQMLQKSFFRDLLAGRVASENELCAYLKILGFAESRKTSPLLVFAIDVKKENQTDGGAESEELLLSCLQLQDAEHQAFLLEERIDRWQVVFMGQEAEDAYFVRECNRTMQSLAYRLYTQLSCELAFHITHSVRHITDLLGADSEQALQEQQVDEDLCQRIVADYKLLILELDRGSKQTLVHLLGQLMLPLQNAPVKDVRFILKNLYSVIELNYKKRKISVWDISNGKFNFNHLYQANNLKTIDNCVKEDFCALCDGLKRRTHTSEHTAIAQIVQYLEEHIDEDISHDAMASKYRIHPGYLSRLFKQEMGETVSEYLLRRRMEKAAALLTEGRYKVGQVAEMVGYSTSSYFSINFKKYTGYSPKEYSQRVLL